MAQALKIVVVGPSRSRKSAIVSFLAGMTDRLDYDPGPTVGVRIVEMERNGVSLQLWDTAGDQTYENTWPAIQKDADGVLILYNADTPGHAKEAELWVEWFVLRPGMPPLNCACVGITGGIGMSLPGPSLEGVGIPCEVVVADEQEAVKRAFDKMVSRIMKRRG